MDSRSKRRLRDAARRKAELQDQHKFALLLEREAGYGDGYSKGTENGRNLVRSEMLAHAGRLFQENKDSDANAVRDVYRRISASQAIGRNGQTAQVADSKKPV